ncbi:MAG TPA: NYN domain-containing protein [Coriobacteriia bacterium]
MRRLIIDGYNLLRGTPRYSGLTERDIDTARERLIADLGARVADGADVTVVFDGGGNPESEGVPSDIGGITVIFSPYGVEADAVIESLAASAREAGESVEVVTSDGATRRTAAGGSVVVTRATTFARELATDESDWRGESGSPRRRATVSDSLPADVRARLDRLAGRRGVGNG